ncbi:hypothetical protein L1049_023386 [Liquidambar formosana]|uniref:Uncharacterized protein n=1 Tax=Liquidambar formosana TaxID=63359 RepID=A0AAP0RTE5_LIQFO
MADREDDEDDINPLTMLLPNEPEDDTTVPTVKNGVPKQQLDEQHYIRSIDSMVLIRQLPSQGLSFQLWPAATTLVTLLDQHRCHPITSPLSSTLSALSDGPDHRPLRILELGSGTGLVGITAAATLGANVTVTDLPHVIPNLQFNADANSNFLAQHGGVVHVAPLRWGKVDDMEVIGRELDLILASDVVYHDHLYDPLLQTLRYFLGGERKMVFVMAHLKRWKKDSAFFKKAKKLFEVEVIHADGPSEGSRVGVVVYRFAGKRQNLKTAASANNA